MPLVYRARLAGEPLAARAAGMRKRQWK